MGQNKLPKAKYMIWFNDVKKTVQSYIDTSRGSTLVLHISDIFILHMDLDVD